MKRIIYIFLAAIFFGLGVLGALLPILPTTPFLLLASYFAARGSKRFNDWIQSTKLYKKHLESYVKDRAMTMDTKVRIVLTAITMLMISFFFLTNWYLRSFILGLIAFILYFFTFRIKTIKPMDN